MNDSNIKQYEDGGYVSHNWTPQVITHFGELTADDYYKASKEMRTGGSIRENYMFGSDYIPSAENGHGKWKKTSRPEEFVEYKSTLPPFKNPTLSEIQVYTQLNKLNENRNGEISDNRDLTSAKHSKNFYDDQPSQDVYSFAKDTGDKFSRFTRVAPEGGIAKNQLHRIETRRPF